MSRIVVIFCYWSGWTDCLFVYSSGGLAAVSSAAVLCVLSAAWGWLSGRSILGDNCFGVAVLALATRAAKRQFHHHRLGDARRLRGSVLVVSDE